MSTNAHPGQSQALEHVRPGSAAPAKFLDFDTMREQARFLAGTGMVPTALQGEENADKIVVVGLLGQELGVPFMAAVSEIHVIEGKASPSAQLRLALIRRAGHEAMFVESTPERAVIRGRRREHRRDPNAWVVVEWTIDQARQAGMLDEFAEEWKKDGNKWKLESRLPLARNDRAVYVHRDTGDALPDWAKRQVASGRVKRRDNWHKYPADMLRARAASALCRMHFSDVLAGLGSAEYTADELGIDTDQDVDDRLDAVLVDEPGPGPEPERVEARLVVVPPATPDPDPEVDRDPAPDAGAEPPVGDGSGELADRWDRIELEKRLGDLHPEFGRPAWEKWKADGLPRIDDPALTKVQAEEAARLLLYAEEAAKRAYDARRRKAFACLADIGIKTDADRHTFVRGATNGETESTGKLTQAQIDAIEQHCLAVKARKANEPDPAPTAKATTSRSRRAATPAPAPEPIPDDPFVGLPDEPPYDEDDPGRPFD